MKLLLFPSDLQIVKVISSEELSVQTKSIWLVDISKVNKSVGSLGGGRYVNAATIREENNRVAIIKHRNLLTLR